MLELTVPLAALTAMSLSQLSLAYTDVAWNGAFATFNSTIGGRLQSATPLALPCFSNYDGHHVIPDPQGCSIVQDIYNSESYRSLRYGNTIYVSRCFLGIYC